MNVVVPTSGRLTDYQTWSGGVSLGAAMMKGMRVTSWPCIHPLHDMAIPETMAAAVLTGHGGLDKLEYRTDVPVPKPRDDEVLIRVAAAGINNTDINTRLGWYSKRVEGATESGGEQGFASVQGADDASWSGTPLTFPRIQGADVAGRIEAVGAAVPPTRVGERVLVRNMLRHYVGRRPYECWTLGSECDGGFAQYVVAPADEVFAVTSELSDASLAAIPCAYSTAEGMLQRAGVGAERVVGMAAVQLAKLRGAEVTALCSASKADAVRAAGASHILDRDASLEGREFDAVLDVVGGPAVAGLLASLRRGGRYAVAGAIGGPLAQIDLRTVYLRDLSLFGCTFQEDAVFAALVAYLAAGKLRPLVSKTYPLSGIRAAQEDFMAKRYAGKLVLVPPA
jgi:NADPH:quinone reductase-like Zn-dependent oxidoreductase